MIYSNGDVTSYIFALTAVKASYPKSTGQCRKHQVVRKVKDWPVDLEFQSKAKQTN
jgi:hypothetical protein